MRYSNIREEELKNKVAQEFFWIYDCTKIVGNVDFCVTMHQTQNELFEQESLLWAEAKTGSSNIYNSLVQLILTIGKARTFEKSLPPPMLGALDGEKIAFIHYTEIHDIFYQNDFNWNVTPSDYETKEFKLVHEKVKASIDQKALLFHFEKDDKELKKFIKNNFVVGKFGLTKTRIDKNNFMVIYNKWLQTVKPTIALRWDLIKKSDSLIDGDFYLADLLSLENESLKDKLSVYLKKDHYELERVLDELGMFQVKNAFFTDKQKAHTQFWNRYDRPPKEEYWDYIVERRDLLVPQDVRERKGSFFTPQIWVELSQKYLTDVLGVDWQDEYTIWDCASGTGNLLHGLTNKYNIWASTLDKQDVEVMHDRIKNGANLLDDHVFQFDFLNDEFAKLPKALRDIINDPEKRKKLVFYINPPYAEASDKKTLDGKEGKSGVEQSATNKRYANILGQGNAELFAQFFVRIYNEIPDCILAEFSTLKILQGQHLNNFRNNFKAKLERVFIVPADTFDNVKGKFPIGFFIWKTMLKESFKEISVDVYDKTGCFVFKKHIEASDNSRYINEWLKPFRAKKNDKSVIGKFPFKGNDFQNQNMIALVHPNMQYNTEAGQFLINSNNLIKASIYFAVRHCIEATWLNDRDQFLYPNEMWETDTEFQNDCLSYTLFHNTIQSKYGVNNWIPFTEYEVGSHEKFDSHFMVKFIQGKLKQDMVQDELFIEDKNQNRTTPLEFSVEAKDVFNAGKELWKYYHKQPNCNVNASLYDIREHFQGRNEKGKMNNKSGDEIYMHLINELRAKLKLIEKKIEPKVYEYGFLK
jgi:hypothetical protein